MSTTHTLEQMKQLRLQGMYHAYRTQLELPIDQQLGGHDLVAQLVQSEALNRNNEKTAYYLKLAKLRLPATVEQIKCSPARNLTKQQMATLIEGRYLQHGENILITGATGCGKSYLACALGHQACLQGYKTSYLNMNRLIEKVTLSKLDGSYIQITQPPRAPNTYHTGRLWITKPNPGSTANIAAITGKSVRQEKHHHYLSATNSQMIRVHQ